MNALVTIEDAPTAGPHGAGHSIFSPRRQAEFLQHLQLFGNVRLAAKAARVSAQTAYRQRRASPALRKAWDAALLAARDHAEQVLASRALDGWEEAVFYHGEEVARRRRYSDRLLLAHLARLDRLEEREEVADTIEVLDGVIDALRGGEDMEGAFSKAVRPEPVGSEADPKGQRLHFTSSAGSKEEAGLPQAQSERRYGNFAPDRVPGVPPCRECGGKCDDPHATLTQADCQWLGNRLDRFHNARPRHAPAYAELASADCDAWEVEALQMDAFEAGVPEWWRIANEDALEDALQKLIEEDG